MVASKLWNIGVMCDEVVQEVGELVALAERHVAADQVLVNHSQVEVVAEGVNVHQVPHLITLLSEEHGELKQRVGGTVSTSTERKSQGKTTLQVPPSSSLANFITHITGKGIASGMSSTVSAYLCNISSMQ